ncbi:MAG: hypothetical protein GC136_09930 [Alphaproteobacteria bacterium]|nr:hypothetical protein [Alphaproteobacteria bacterium]
MGKRRLSPFWDRALFGVTMVGALGVSAVVGGVLWKSYDLPGFQEIHDFMYEPIGRPDPTLPYSYQLNCNPHYFDCRVVQSMQTGVGNYLWGVIEDTNNYRISVPIAPMTDPSVVAPRAIYNMTFSEGVVVPVGPTAHEPPTQAPPVATLPPPAGDIEPSAGQGPVENGGLIEIKRGGRAEQAPAVTLPGVDQPPPRAARDYSGLRCVFAQATWLNGDEPPQGSPRVMDLTLMEDGAPLPVGYTCVYGI